MILAALEKQAKTKAKEQTGFLAEHTWLIILAVVAFLVEKYIKKRR